MKTKIKIQSISAWSIGIALILTVVFVVILHYGKNEVKRFEDATDQYIVCENAARQLQDGSDYLTEQVRLYAMTGERNYLDQYFEEADVTKRREQALESLKKYFDKTEAFQSLQQAMEDSKELMLTEYHSLKLVATVMGEKDIPAELEQLDLPEEEKQLSQKEKLEKAQKLVSNNSKLNSGADQLADGAGQIQDGSSKLYDGSKELGDGITKLEDGSDTLATSLNDGAKEVKETNASDDTISMFATPITDEETKITTVENNGHAMAPYMMSVGLWVGCLAFCLMYPLTEYKGKLKSGFAWWGSKASVLYPVAVLQGVLLILLLHVFDGFTPVEMTKTILFAALTGVCFTSIMYFFNITFGKVGSFLMLIFMVVQLAGSAGTYPVEISPSFVAKIHYYLPFTYTVNAFRSTICGGESIRQAVIVLIGLTIIFSILTILQFNHMARRKKQGKLVLLDWLEEKGVA